MDGSAIFSTAQPAGRSRPGWVQIALPTVGWLTLAALVAFGAWKGVEWRRELWDETRSIRFTFDISNGYNLGRSVVDRTKVPAGQPVPFGVYWTAYLDSYRTAIDEAKNRPTVAPGLPDYQLDYAPGRLFIMSMWVRHLWEQGKHQWENTYESTAPLLHVNAVASAMTAIAMFALVRHWRRYRTGDSIWPDWRSPWREFPAAIAMLAVWLNPALMWNTHAWPQWDCWLLPFFVVGVLLASKEQWLAAGFVIAMGGLFKGQFVMTAPVLILWALFTGRPLAAVRFVIGIALLAAIVSFVWIARAPVPRLYAADCIAAIAAGFAVIGVRRKFDLVGYIAASVAGVLIALVLIKSFNLVTFTAVVLLVGLIAVAPRWMPRPLFPAAIALALTGSIFLAGYAWGETYDWFEVSYRYPMDRRQYMSIGPITNLPAILSHSPYRWNLTEIVIDPIGTERTATVIRVSLIIAAVVVGLMLLGLAGLDYRQSARNAGRWAVRCLPLALVAWIYPWGEALTMRHFLVWLYSLTLVLCAVGAAIHYHQRNPRVMLALFVPWLLMFAVMPQMHERYLVWAAVLLCVGFGVSLGHGLLAAPVIFLAWVNMAGSMVYKSARDWPLSAQTVRPMMPGAGWAVLMLALVYLYLALKPEKTLATDGHRQAQTKEKEELNLAAA